jgi:hypothetical protein
MGWSFLIFPYYIKLNWIFKKQNNVQIINYLQTGEF